MQIMEKRVEPKLYRYDDITVVPISVNTERTVIITDVYGETINGYVKSASRRPLYHKVTVDVNGANIIGGECTCESTKYYGRPCKHMLKLRNAAVRIGII